MYIEKNISNTVLQLHLPPNGHFFSLAKEVVIHGPHEGVVEPRCLPHVGLRHALVMAMKALDVLPGEEERQEPVNIGREGEVVPRVRVGYQQTCGQRMRKILYVLLHSHCHVIYFAIAT